MIHEASVWDAPDNKLRDRIERIAASLNTYPIESGHSSSTFTETPYSYRASFFGEVEICVRFMAEGSSLRYECVITRGRRLLEAGPTEVIETRGELDRCVSQIEAAFEQMISFLDGKEPIIGKADLPHI
jgi:hypothetical protein